MIDLKRAETFNATAWILNNGIVNENGSPIEFKDHAFLIDPFVDDTPEQVAMKCAQIGWSVLAILRSFHLAYYGKANIIHTFPSRNMSKDFVIPKVNPLIRRNPTISAMAGIDSLNLKQIGDRFIYYRGSYEQTEAISISAHILINDEYDRSNQRVLKTYRSRLDDAKRERPELGWEWQFSNPSIPGYGVDVWWQKSDQKNWMIKCRGCGKWQTMRWPDNIDFNRKIKQCRYCFKEIDRDTLTNGQWVQHYRDKRISGYHISQMIVPWISAAKIIEDSEGDPEIFHNFTLGLPYVSKDMSVSRESITRCISPGYNPRTDVAMGVDNGKTKHYIIGNRQGIFAIGETDSWDEIERLRNHYNAVMVIDANPYPHTPQQLASKYPGMVFIHYYQSDKKNMGVIRWDMSEGVVKSDRTKILDHVVAEINSGDVTFNLTVKELEPYIYHWRQLFRMIKTMAGGMKKPSWETIEGRPDHYAHAHIYWRVALEQTLNQGGIVRAGTSKKKGLNPTVGYDGTVPALDLKEVASRAALKNKKTTVY